MESSKQVVNDTHPQMLEDEPGPDALELELEEDRELEGEADGPSEAEEERSTVAAARGLTDAFQLYLRDIQKTKLLSAAEEKALALKVEQGDKAARDLMITSNLRLVVKIAKGFLNRGLPFLDLIEEGNLGLIKAVERFEVARGFRFSTYATWWIRQTVERALMNQVHTIRLPVHVSEEIGKFYRVSNRFRKQMNREPTVAELAEAMEVDVSRVRKLKVLMLRTLSIDKPMGEYDSFFLAETLLDTSTPSPVDQIEGVTAYALASSLIDGFPEAEKKVLTLRFGLDDNEPQTLETIGRSFGVTRERIRQIESSSLLKLRKLMQSHDGTMACC